MPETGPEPTPGVRLDGDGGSIGVWSASATSVELSIFDSRDPNWIVEQLPLTRGPGDLWTGRSGNLTAGTRYALAVAGPTGPRHSFDPNVALLDPYARGIVRPAAGQLRSVVVDGAFDWGDSGRPATPLDHTVVYETHVKGVTKLLAGVPESLRGSYAGLAHPATIAHLTSLGVTAVELLPVQAFESEQRLIKQGLVNYWGYNTLGFFAPHPGYATKRSRAQGPEAVLREFKGMVRLLHEAGIEVFLDVVYNHTAEEGPLGPTSSLRGIDNSSYYRQDDQGRYIDTTGCGNTIDYSHPAAQRLLLDSLRYWSDEVRIDGFRFDLAATLGRTADGSYSRDHPLLSAIRDDPSLRDTKIIAEPWDVGMGGWQTGNFPDGWSEWNDRYRDRVRTFWLRDIGDARAHGSSNSGIGDLATELAGSSQTFALERGPLASLNFVTAHDGFTAWDLTAYDTKHNVGNGEENRDGTNDNNSFNHGAEGPTADPRILADRRRAVRNLLGTLLLSAGVPMITAGDEFGRTQNGNNNAYCHDDELTWFDWRLVDWQRSLLAHTTRLIALRRENPALRPVRYGRFGETVPSASQMDWYDTAGRTMDEEDWQSPANRTLQYLAASTPEFEEFNRILLVVHGVESDVEVTLPEHEGVSGYTLLWDSADEDPLTETAEHAPGSTVLLGATSMRLFRAHG